MKLKGEEKENIFILTMDTVEGYKLDTSQIMSKAHPTFHKNTADDFIHQGQSPRVIQ